MPARNPDTKSRGAALKKEDGIGKSEGGGGEDTKGRGEGAGLSRAHLPKYESLLKLYRSGGDQPARKRKGGGRAKGRGEEGIHRFVRKKKMRQYHRMLIQGKQIFRNWGTSNSSS